MKASKSNDKTINALCAKICVVPYEVKMELMRLFISRCRELYSIAFLQWRLKYPSHIQYNKEILEDAIHLRIFNLTTELVSTEKIS